MEETLSFGAVNYAVLMAYLAGMVFIGYLFSHQQKTAADFFLAARKIPWIAVGMSVFATVTSAISYLGIPGLVYNENMSFYVGMLMMPVAAPFIIWVFLPFYQKLNVTTSYEYIYLRFGQNARYCVSGLFLCARLGWLGTVIYAPALALAVVTGLDLWVSVLFMGVISTVYSVMGGMAAVIWTDVAQFVILVGGAAIVAVSLALAVPGGVPEILRVAQDTGHLNLMSWEFSLTEMTMSAVVISYFFNFLHDYGVDQITVQRLLAARRVSDMARATIVNAIAVVVVFAILGFVGLGLFAFYAAHPGRLPEGLKADEIFPYYTVHSLPQGISGLVIAGVFAAAMSSLASGINSLATVVINDFVRPLRKKAVSEAFDIRLARVLTFTFGVFATGVAFFAASIGEIVKTSQSFLGLFSGPVLALFLLGMLTRRGRFHGWIVGVLVALPATIWLQRATDVHFVYYFPFSFFLSFLVGLLASYALPRQEVDPELTMRKPEKTSAGA